MQRAGHIHQMVQAVKHWLHPQVPQLAQSPRNATFFWGDTLLKTRVKIRSHQEALRTERRLNPGCQYRKKLKVYEMLGSNGHLKSQVVS